jgi:uncharacterized protein
MELKENTTKWWRLLLSPLERIFAPRARAAVIAAGLGAPLLAAVLGSRLLTDYLWFREVGQGDVFLRELAWKAAIVAGVGTVASLWLFAALGTATLLSPVRATFARAEAGAVGCVLLGFAVGLRSTGQWQAVDLWLHRSAFGATDPVHHQDVGFFVFTLPVLRAVSDTALAIMALGMLLAAAVYAVSGALSFAPLRVTSAAWMHLAILAALALAGLAVRLSLTTYSIEVTRAGSGSAVAFPGADYVDARVRIPAMYLIAVLIVLCGAAVVVGAYLTVKGHRRAAARLVAWPVLAAACLVPVGLLAVPWVVQEFVVKPQPVEKEGPLLQAALDATSRAFALANVNVIHTAAPAPIPASALEASGPLADVQVWGSSVAAQWLTQLESATPYFRVGTPTLQAEQVAGQQRPVVFAERELDPDWVPGRAAGWADSALVFTHGLGSFSVSASGIGPDGEPQLLPGPPLTQPQVYFGRQPPDAAPWVVVNTRRSEADGVNSAGQPQPDHYQGTGGIELSSWIRRAAFAVRLASPSLLLSSDITPQSRIIMHRDVIDRLTTVAGFIRWDPTTTSVVSGGHVMFIADGYTTSTDYPEAQPARLAGGWVNYARASVVATVDAYSGQARLYLADDSDPIARAWAASFPGLFLPFSGLPAGLRDELRYPAALFDAQAGLYQQFHTQDPEEFASGADVWGYPTSLSGSIGAAGNIRFGSAAQSPGTAMLPEYRLAVTPGNREALSLMRTALYTPASGQNIVAEFDGWIGDDGRPRLAAVEFPGDQVVLGPAQISRLVFTTPSVTSALRLVNKETTDLDQHSLAAVVLGIPAWLRLDGGILQVQPVYLEAAGSGATRMLDVSVYVNGRVGIGGTLTEAIEQATSP